MWCNENVLPVQHLLHNMLTSFTQVRKYASYGLSPDDPQNPSSLFFSFDCVTNSVVLVLLLPISHDSYINFHIQSFALFR